MVTPLDVKGYLASALVTLEQALQRANRTDGLCVITVLSGDIPAYDYGGEQCGGMAWVRLVGLAPTTQFPQPGVLVTNCAWTYAIEIEFGLIRATTAEPVDVGGAIQLPGEDDYALEVDEQMSDLFVLQDAVESFEAELKVIGSYIPFGPQGFAVGGTWRVVVGDF